MAEAKFKDNALTKIIAFDFDNTLTDSNIYPAIGKPRKYAVQVVNLLHQLGVTVIIWTCRDSVNKWDNIHDDITPVRQWLDQHGFQYDDINSSIKYAPFKYEARKIYAHMYVDDRAFGWDDTDEDIMIKVLVDFMRRYSHWDDRDIINIANRMRRGEEVNF